MLVEHPCATIDGMADPQIIPNSQITTGTDLNEIAEGVTFRDPENLGTAQTNVTSINRS